MSISSKDKIVENDGCSDGDCIRKNLERCGRGEM